MLIFAAQWTESAASVGSSPSLYPIYLGHHRALSWAPCTIQQVLTISFTHHGIYMSISSHFTPYMSTGPFSISASVFLPYKKVHLYHFSRFHTYMLMHGMCFSLTNSLCLIDPMSIHICINDPTLFLFMTEKCFIVYMYDIFFIHSSGFRLLPYPGNSK